MSQSELAEMVNPSHEITLRLPSGAEQTFSVRSLSLRQQVEIEKRLDTPWNEINFGSAAAKMEVVYFMLKAADGSITRDVVGDVFNAENVDELERLMLHAVIQGDLAELEYRQVKKLRQDRMAELQEGLPEAVNPLVTRVTQMEEPAAAE